MADLNAALGFVYQHAGYGDGPLPEEVPAIWPPSDPLSGPYVDEYLLGSTDVVKQVDGDTTFYFIPTTDLPLLDPLRNLGVPEPVLNIFQPALQVIVEAGYDRSIPFGDPTPAELIPTIDPATFTLEFANPFTALIDMEAPLGACIQNRLDITCIQQDLLDPVLGLVGTLGGLFTS